MATQDEIVGFPSADPFALDRAADEKNPPLPVDRLDADQILQLRANIKKTYETWFPGPAPNKSVAELLEEQLDPTRPLTDRWGVWVAHVESAIARSPTFQMAVINEEITPGSYDFKHYEVDLDWLLGLYLPGFYDVFEDFADATDVLKEMAKLAVGFAKTAIGKAIRLHASRTLLAVEHGIMKGKTPAPPAPTNEYIIELFKLVRQEKSINELRARTYQDLQGLGPLLPSLSKGKALLDRYQDNTSARNTLVDRFMDAAIEAVRTHMSFTNSSGMAASPVNQTIVDEGLKSVRTHVDLIEGEITEYGKDDDAGLDAAERGGMFYPDEDKLDLPEEALVRNELVPDLYAGNPVWFYPGWRSGKQGPGAFRAASESEPFSASQDTTGSQEDEAYAIPEGVPASFKRSKGFCVARMLSSKEELEIEANINTAEDVLQGAIGYLDTCLHRTEFNKRDFLDCATTLAKTTERSAVAVKADKSDVRFRSFNDIQFLDNWVHVRYLLAAIRTASAEAKSPILLDFLRDAEQYLLIVFAVIRGGASDPLPWFLVLEGLLRWIWKSLPTSTLSMLHKKLYNELVLWAHGTAINAFVIRVPKSAGKYDQVVGAWYPLLWKYDPTCAQQDCMRLLTHPDKITGKAFRQLMSVGTREARVGMRAMRSWISENRDSAYICLYEALRTCRPMKEVVVMMFYYSHLYHNRTCKATRGKHAITAF